MANQKQYTAREVAEAVLKKTSEILQKSELLQKYQPENSKKLGYKPSVLGAQEKDQNEDDKNYEVEPGKAKNKKRERQQMNPSKNPKEQAEEDAEHRLDNMIDKAENPDKEADAKLGEDVEHLVEDHAGKNLAAERKEGHRFLKAEDFAELNAELEVLAKAQIPQHGGQPGPQRSEASIPASSGAPYTESEPPVAEQAPAAAGAFVPAKQIGSAKLAKFCERVYAKRKAGAQAAPAPGAAPAAAPAAPAVAAPAAPKVGQ